MRMKLAIMEDINWQKRQDLGKLIIYHGKKRKNLTVKYIVDNEISLYKLIESGVGIGFIPRFIVKELKNVVEIALEPLCVFDIYSVRSNVRNSSHLEIVETFLKNSITSGVCYDQNKQSNNKNRRFRKHPRA